MDSEDLPLGGFNKLLGLRLEEASADLVVATVPVTPDLHQPYGLVHGGVYSSTTPHQLRQTMRNLLDNLEEADMNFDEVVSTNVYLDNLSELQDFDEIYKEYFGPVMPAQSVVQQIAPADRKADKDGHYPDLEQVSLIAVRKKGKH